VTSEDPLPPSPRGVRSSLLALGSAAILAVYAVGYVRTRPAAERFDHAESGRRRPSPDPVLPHKDTIVAAEPAPHPAMVSRAKSVRHDKTVANTAVTPTSKVESVVVAAAPTTPAIPTTPTTPTSSPVDTTQQATTVAAADSLHPRLKDGRYRGWGYSQHGNIESEVEIQDGRIVSASVTQCLTAYSCSYVHRLQDQVVVRQSPNVDTISGATQSSDAFYWGVVNALAKAK
jgi:uncharacterized protein with FMN-binding domain